MAAAMALQVGAAYIHSWGELEKCYNKEIAAELKERLKQNPTVQKSVLG